MTHRLCSFVSMGLRQAFGSQLRRNMSSGTLVAICNLGVSAVSYPVYLDYLGYEQYGVWLLLAVVLTFIQTGGSLGIDQAVLKLVAEEYGRDDLHGIQNYVTMGFAVLGASGAIAMAILVVFKVQIIAALGLTGANVSLAMDLLPYVGLLSVYILIIGVLRGTLCGLGRMDLANYIDSGGRICAVLVVVLLLCFKHGVESLLIGNMVSCVLVHCAYIVVIRRCIPLRVLRLSNWSTKRLGRLVRFGSGIFGSSLLAMLVSPFNKLMLSHYAGVASIPIYELAFTGSVMIRSLLVVGFNALMPEISRLRGVASAQAQERVASINRRSMRVILLYGMPVCALILVVAEPMLKFWLRANYLDALTAAFRVMLIARFVNVLAVPAYHTLIAVGQVRYCFLATCIAAGTNSILVSCIALMTQRITVNQIAAVLIVVFSASSLYTFYKYRTAVSVWDDGSTVSATR